MTATKKDSNPGLIEKIRSWYNSWFKKHEEHFDSEAITRPVPSGRCVSSDLFFKPGATIQGRYDSYEVLNLISDTALSEVYKGMSKVHGEEIAIKAYLGNYSKCFERERYVHKLLDSRGGHGNIIPAHEFVVMEDDRRLGIFPYVAGENLGEIVEREGKLTPQQVLPLVSSLCDALEHIHRLDIVHRDIKPANIMISAEENIRKEMLEFRPEAMVLRLFDFGTSWHKNIMHLDEPGSAYGTPYYMAPETLEGEPPHKVGDLYAAGIIIYQSLAGCAPFRGSTSTEVFLQHLRTPVPDITLYNDKVSKDVKQVIEKALAKDPEKRYQTAGELKRDYIAVVK